MDLTQKEAPMPKLTMVYALLIARTHQVRIPVSPRHCIGTERRRQAQ